MDKALYEGFEDWRCILRRRGLYGCTPRSRLVAAAIAITYRARDAKRWRMMSLTWYCLFHAL
jgi:hypothetical protein